MFSRVRRLPRHGHRTINGKLSDDRTVACTCFVISIVLASESGISTRGTQSAPRTPIKSSAMATPRSPSIPGGKQARAAFIFNS
jgi:hypothetical protein